MGKLSHTFEAQLTHGSLIIVPPAIAETYVRQQIKRLAITVTFDQHQVTYQGALLQKKALGYYMYLSNAKQKQLGLFPSDYFEVRVQPDDSMYGAPMTEEFEAVFLSDPEAMQCFELLTPGKKRSILFAIARFKSSQTRIDKALLVAENLKRGITRPQDWFKRW